MGCTKTGQIGTYRPLNDSLFFGIGSAGDGASAMQPENKQVLALKQRISTLWRYFKAVTAHSDPGVLIVKDAQVRFKLCRSGAETMTNEHCKSRYTLIQRKYQS
jgi:hypothetical protein